ncbi:MAG: hypothetical protein ACQESC_03705 [Nanobdellota archaeon]
MDVDTEHKLVVGGIVLVILAVILAFVFTGGSENSRVEELSEVANNTVEQAEETTPFTPIIDPEVVSGEPIVLGVSLYNPENAGPESEACESKGARLDVSCQELSVNQTVSLIPIKIGTSENIYGTFTFSGAPGLYRCNFSVLCDDTAVATSQTTVTVT